MKPLEGRVAVATGAAQGEIGRDRDEARGASEDGKVACPLLRFLVTDLAILAVEVLHTGVVRHEPAGM
jgi:hypothetical protein